MFNVVVWGLVLLLVFTFDIFVKVSYGPQRALCIPFLLCLGDLGSRNLNQGSRRGKTFLLILKTLSKILTRVTLAGSVSCCISHIHHKMCNLWVTTAAFAALGVVPRQREDLLSNEFCFKILSSR